MMHIELYVFVAPTCLTVFSTKALNKEIHYERTMFLPAAVIRGRSMPRCTEAVLAAQHLTETLRAVLPLICHLSVRTYVCL